MAKERTYGDLITYEFPKLEELRDKDNSQMIEWLYKIYKNANIDFFRPEKIAFKKINRNEKEEDECSELYAGVSLNELVFYYKATLADIIVVYECYKENGVVIGYDFKEECSFITLSKKSKVNPYELAKVLGLL